MELKYLEAYIDVYELEVWPWALSIWLKLLDNPQLTLHNFSRNWYVLTIFKELLNGDIDLEEFMKVGDVTSEKEIEWPLVLFEALSYIKTMRNVDEMFFDNWVILLDRFLLWKVDVDALCEEVYFV